MEKRRRKDAWAPVKSENFLNFSRLLIYIYGKSIEK
jgi:hypothetical protein